MIVFGCDGTYTSAATDPDALKLEKALMEDPYPMQGLLRTIEEAQSQVNAALGISVAMLGRK